MTAHLDHLILRVNDLDVSLRFYTELMGFTPEGRSGPFAAVRVGPSCLLQLAPWGTEGGEHYAFALDAPHFEAVLARVLATGLDHGPSFDLVGSQGGLGTEVGACGPAPTLYFFDPNRHLIEIRTYAPRAAAQPS